MDLKEQNIKLMTELLMKAGHPDPVEAIARGLVLTGLTLDAEPNDRGQSSLFGNREAHRAIVGGTTTDVPDAALEVVAVATHDAAAWDLYRDFEKVHVAFNWNASVAKQKRWGGKVKKYLAAIERAKTKVREALDIPSDEPEHEYHRDELDDQWIKAFAGHAETIEREPMKTAQDLYVYGREDSIWKDLQYMRDTAQVSETDLLEILQNTSISEAELVEERAIVAIMDLMDRPDL